MDAGQAELNDPQSDVMCYSAAIMMQRRQFLPALFLVMAACQSAPDAGENALNESVAAPEEAALPKISRPLTRRDILMAAAEAASDFAAGVEDDVQQRPLNGQPFSFRIRYCGSTEADTAFQVVFDPKRGVLRVAARPDIDLSVPLVRGLAPKTAEAAEGFWVARPWLLEAACPTPNPSTTGDEAVAASATVEVPTARQATVGLAEFYDGQSTRALRRAGRAYQATQKIDDGLKDSRIDLVLEGRLKNFDGKAVLCTGGAADAPPTCIVSVEFDRIRLELGDGQLLGEWSGT